jgi:hypothetical protein
VQPVFLKRWQDHQEPETFKLVNVGQFLVMCPHAAGRNKELAMMFCGPLRKRNGKVLLAQFAWSIHMTLFSSCVLLIIRGAGHICVVLITITLTASNILKKLMRRKNWLWVLQLSPHMPFL